MEQYRVRSIMRDYQQENIYLDMQTRMHKRTITLSRKFNPSFDSKHNKQEQDS